MSQVVYCRFRLSWMKACSLLLATTLIACKQSPGPPAAEDMAPARPMPANARTIEFEADAPGGTPSGFHSVVNNGRPGVWQVQQVEGAPSGTQAVVQTDADKTNSRFPVLVYEALRAADVDVSVRYQAISGSVDQAAGLVWRYRDPNNYYVVRANALEDNVVLYKMEKGERIDLPVKSLSGGYGVKADVPDRGYGTLRVTARGPLFEVYVGDRKLFEVEDRTFTAAGRVGLWTKADSITRFDDLKVASLDGPLRAK